MIEGTQLCTKLLIMKPLISNILKTSILFLITSIPSQLKGQNEMVISQIITGDLVTAVEVYNTGANSITLTSANFGVQISPDNKQNNIQTWSPTSNLTLGGREVLVVVAAGSQKDAFISYLNEVNANFVDASATLSSADNDAIQIAYNASGTILANGNSAIDRIGDWLKSNAGFSGQSNITDENLERELEHLFTGYTAVGDVTGTGFTAKYSAATAQASITAPYTRDDFEGFGISPGNFEFNGTNWVTPTDATGTSDLPTVSTSCVLELVDNTSSSIDNNKSIAKIVLGENSSLTLGASATGYSQSKRIIRRLNTATLTSERYFGNDGWHIIGTPFPNGFNNTQGRGVSARYWYWIGGEWSEATGSTVPDGLAIMVRVGSAYSYSYTGVVPEPFLPEMGVIRMLTSFTWDRTGASDGDLFYVSDGHSSVSQGSGWNLLSNPLPCALDWNAMYDNGNTNNIDATVYIWNPTTNGWINFNALSDAGSVESGLIPPNGAFLVKVSSDAPASIAVDVDSHGSLTVPSTSYNKQFSYPTDVIHVGITDITSSASNYFMVSHDRNRIAADYDPGLDSWFKMSTGDNIPDIYFPEGEHGQIFQNVTDLSQPQAIPVGTTDLTPGNTYTISVEQFVDGNEYHVTLEDTYTNSMIDLSLQPHSFTQLYETVDDRFILHINQNTVGVDEALNHDYYSFTRDNELYINPGSLDIKTIKVLSIDGKIIGNVPYKENSKIIELPNRGIYVVEIQAGQGTFTDKVVY